MYPELVGEPPTFLLLSEEQSTETEDDANFSRADASPRKTSLLSPNKADWRRNRVTFQPQCINASDGETTDPVVLGRALKSLLSRLSTISDAANDQLPIVETNDDLQLPLSIPETSRSAHQNSSQKAPGSDAIQADVYKHGIHKLMEPLPTLFREL
ncbi:hypothetical protein SprV_0100376300 [Sparganum proliferum]